MLPKERRIKRENFSHILSKGARLNSKSLLLYVSSLDQPGNLTKTKIAFSVSKKICPKATDRNKYRRRGYSAIERYIDKVKPGYFMFFSFKKGSVPVKTSELEKEIVGLLSNSGVLK